MTGSKQTSSLVSQLPPALQVALAELARTARNSFGELRSLPHILASHSDVIASLLSECGNYERMAAVLAEIGVSRSSGQPFPASSLTSASCRVRQQGRRLDTSAPSETTDVATHRRFEMDVSSAAVTPVRKATGPPSQKRSQPPEIMNHDGGKDDIIEPGNARAAQLLTSFRRPPS